MPRFRRIEPQRISAGSPRHSSSTAIEGSTMKAWLAVLSLCAASLAPATGRAQAPVDSLALARQYTTWLYAGEADSLLAHSSDENRNEEGARDRYVQMSQLIAQRAGFELEVSEETWKLRNGDCQYW